MPQESDSIRPGLLDSARNYAVNFRDEWAPFNAGELRAVLGVLRDGLTGQDNHPQPQGPGGGGGEEGGG